MARIAYRAGRPSRLTAETADELALLSHGSKEGGRILLGDAWYPVDRNALVLPDSASPATAIDLATRFTEAARRHREAQARRAAFRVLRP